jgi:hypothetical protein
MPGEKRMEKKEILSALDEEREQFLEAIEGLSEAKMVEAGVVGEWSVKDIMAHLSRWEAELVKLLWQAKQGQRPTTIHFTSPDIDEVNSRWYQEMGDRSLERVLEDFHGVRNQTIRRVESLSDKDLSDPKRYAWLEGRPLIEWIKADSFGHEAEHAEQIHRWRSEK